MENTENKNFNIFQAEKGKFPTAPCKFVELPDGRVIFGEIDSGVDHKDLLPDKIKSRVVNAGLLTKIGDEKWILFSASGELVDIEGRDFMKMKKELKAELNKQTSERLNELYEGEYFSYAPPFKKHD